MNKHRWIPTVLALLAFLLVSCSQQRGLGDILEKEVPRLMELSDIPGLSIALIRDGEIFWTGAFGVRSTETQQPIDEETIFEAASLSKTVSAVAVLKLVERGELDLDTPLYEYLPYPKLAKDERYKKITARLVMTHTTGLPNWGNKLIREPGERFGYSGEGFLYLGRTLEKITGMSLEEFAQKEIFGPLGMTRSSYVWNDQYEENGANGHDRLSLANKMRQNTKPNAGASLLTTPRDYATFLCAIINDQILKPETIDLMLTPHVRAYKWEEPEEDEYISWGFGWGIQPGNTENGFFHWGNNGDLRGFTLAYKNKKEGLIFFSNSENAFGLAEPLLALITDESQWIFQWFDWQRYDHPERLARRSFEKAFMEEGAEAGRKKLSEVRTQYPELIELRDLISTARILDRRGKHKETAALYKIILDIEPKNKTALQGLAYTDMNQGSFQAALSNAKNWAEALPKDKTAQKAIEWIQELIKIEEEPVSIPLEVLEKYAGDYTDRHVRLEQGTLFYHAEGREEFRLIPIDQNTFCLDGYQLFRLRFQSDEHGNITHLIGIYIQGRTDRSDRNK